MSAIYRIVSPRRLTAPVLVARTLEARVVYHHLLCGEVACQVPGLVRVGVLGLAEEANLDPGVVRRALQELALHSLIEVDEAARLIRLPGVPSDHARAFAGPNNVKGCIEALRSFPESPIRERHAEELQAVCPPELRPLWTGLLPRSKPAAARPEPPEPGAEPPSNPLPDPVPNPLPNPVRTKEQEKEQEKEVPVDDASASGRERDQFDPSELARRLRIAREGGAVPLSPEAAAKRSGVPAPTIRAFEDGRAIPTADEVAALSRAYGDPGLADLQLPDRDPGLAATVVATLHRHRLDLGLAAPEDPVPDVSAEVVRLVFSPEEPPEQLAGIWRTVLSRAAEEIRRELEDRRGTSRSAQYFTLEVLSRPKTRRKYLDNPDLGRRRAPPPARGTRRGLKGPPPPENDDLPVEVERM